MKTLQKIKITDWYVHVYENEGGRQDAELIGVDAEGNEYQTQNKVYVIGEYYDVEPSIICTDKAHGSLNPTP